MILTPKIPPTSPADVMNTELLQTLQHIPKNIKKKIIVIIIIKKGDI